MKVFLINLNKNPERLAAADSQLRRVGVDYERFPAVYGKALTVEERRRSVRRFRGWCAMGRRLMDGEVGCALSHIGIYRRMVEENVPCAMILEDDCKLAEAFPEALRVVDGWMDSTKPQVVLLTHHQGNVPNGEDGVIHEICGEMFTEGYAITLEGARALLAANWPVITVADSWNRWVRQGDIRLYKYAPAVVSQDWERFTESDINEAGRLRVDALPLWRRLSHKALRCVGVVLDRTFEYVRRIQK